MRRLWLAIAGVAALLGASPLVAGAPAARLSVAGVLGNSGEAGPTLVRVAPSGLDGVVLDASGTLWLGAGNAINRVTLEGRLVERFPLELAPGERMYGPAAFALLGETLYFTCVDAARVGHLFALPMRSGARAARVPLSFSPAWSGVLQLAPEPLDGRLVLAVEEKDRPSQVSIFFYDPATRVAARAFAVPAPDVFGVAVDTARRWVYVGSLRSTFAVDPQGRPVSDAFPAPATELPATPTLFTGAVRIAGGALWQASGNGFLARLDSMVRLSPGIVARWRSELGTVHQVLDLGGGLLVLVRDEPADTFLARWDSTEGELRFLRRIGALPAIGAVGLSDDGWVTVADEVGVYPLQHWWHWDDDARAMPAFTDRRGGRGTGFFAPASDAFVAIAGGGLAVLRPHSYQAAVSLPPFPASARPVAIGYRIVPGESLGRIFYADAAARQLASVRYDGIHLRATPDQWAPVPIAGTDLQAPTDIAALTDGRLVVADVGRILVLVPMDTGYRLATTFRGWGRGKDDQLGAHLHVAIDGRSLLVSDTDRQRVVWIDWVRWKKVAQLGVTDHAGDDLDHVDHPAAIAIRGSRAVLADAGNQRVLKLVLDQR